MSKKMNQDVFGLSLDIHEYGGVSRESDPNDEWSGEDTWTSYDVNGIRYISPTETKVVADLVRNGTPRWGEVYHVVTLTYSTGDSFSSHSGYRCLPIAAYDTEAAAEDCRRILEADGSEYNFKDNHVLIPNPDGGEPISIYRAWAGYFESIDDVTVRSFALNSLN